MQLNQPKYLYSTILFPTKCYKMEGEINCYIHYHDLTEVGCKQCVGVFIYIIIGGECSSPSALFKRSAEKPDPGLCKHSIPPGWQPCSALLHKIILRWWHGAVTLTLPWHHLTTRGKVLTLMLWGIFGRDTHTHTKKTFVQPLSHSDYQMSHSQTALGG